MQLMAIGKSGTGLWRRLISPPTWHRKGRAPEAADELVPSSCFGPVGDPETEARLSDLVDEPRAAVLYDSR
jgi:hypothetical protein